MVNTIFFQFLSKSWANATGGWVYDKVLYYAELKSVYNFYLWSSSAKVQTLLHRTNPLIHTSSSFKKHPSVYSGLQPCRELHVMLLNSFLAVCLCVLSAFIRVLFQLWLTGCLMPPYWIYQRTPLNIPSRQSYLTTLSWIFICCNKL